LSAATSHSNIFDIRATMTLTFKTYSVRLSPQLHQ